MFPLREAIWNFYLQEILDALLQLLFDGELFLRSFLFAAYVRLPGAWRQSPEQVTFPPHLRLLDQLHGALLNGPVQGLDVALARYRTADHCLLGRAGLWLAVAAGGGEVIAGGAALPFVSLAILAAAITVRGGPPGRLTWKGNTDPQMSAGNSGWCRKRTR